MINNQLNSLQELRVITERHIFNDVEKDDLHSFDLLSIIKITLLISYLLAEYYSAIKALTINGEKIDLILPLLGTILNIFTGFYKGYEILYSQYCSMLIKQYQKILGAFSAQ